MSRKLASSSLLGAGLALLMVSTSLAQQAPAGPTTPPAGPTAPPAGPGAPPAAAGAPTTPAAPVVIPDYKSVTQEMLTTPADGDWPNYRRTYDGWGYSPLNQITTDNVADMEPVWMISTGAAEGHESPPMVINGIMFVTQATTTSNQVMAIKADTGEILWRYQRALPEDMHSSHPTNRGVGFWGDKIFFTSRDAVLVALDAKSGAEVWTAPIDDYKNGYYANLAPLVIDGKVIVGTSGGERGIRGFVAAFNADDGKEVWRTYTIPAPGEPGSETWPDNEAWKTGAGSTWITGHYDPENKLIYWGVGNGGPWMGDQRPGDNLYVTSVIALDPESGEIKGHFQYHPNDSFDWDEVAAPILVDLPNKDGETVPGLVHAARNGVLWELERKPDGEIGFIKGTPYVKENWIKSMDPETGRVEYAEGTKPGTGILGDFCPSFWGGKDWPPIAYDPETNYVFIPANENLCTKMQGGTVVEYRPGASFTRGTQGDRSDLYLAEGADHIGEVQAWDLSTGEKVWTHEFPNSANWGPLMTTAGGLVFGGGTNDNMFRAFDAKSGDIVWEMKLNSSVIGVPSSFEVDGKQYVSVQAGWGIDAASMQSRLATSYPDKFKPGPTVPTGGVIWVFALPEEN
ncbi:MULTISPECIES: methanol/ethanol family PQQ-dependent dehydrogenase [Chelativorans]|uniref:methanol/ethanol family PQQ-dependent dehydrogenase n=1 Tax=Chelativorans TaxID=449972 RepID=UPI0012EDC6F7|nr:MULTISPECIES: methanol/ethanol family PQQ-dependent dehydrogenase [Chelativorans]